MTFESILNSFRVTLYTKARWLDEHSQVHKNNNVQVPDLGKKDASSHMKQSQ